MSRSQGQKTIVGRGRLIWLLAATLLTGCPGLGLGGEQGADCFDGRDNDDDGFVDCDDPDCRGVLFCRAPLDSSLPAPPPRPDLGFSERDAVSLWPDKGVTPDAAPRSSLGKACAWLGYVSLCSDQTSYCVKSPAGGAFCTATCSTIGSCPEIPGSNTVAECLYSLAGQKYCVFLCRLLDQPFACPTELTCYASAIPSQKWCWP